MFRRQILAATSEASRPRFEHHVGIGFGCPPDARETGLAASVGYDSESAFSRAFKRATGSAPTRWRKQAAAKARLALE